VGGSFWFINVGVVVVLASLPRMVRAVYPNGKRDAAAIAVYRRASMLPLFTRVGVLLLVGGAGALFPEWGLATTWVMSAVAIIGCLWVVERGIRSVRRYRRDEEAGKRGPDHPWPYRRRS
jgi:hypothetical protein